ncbi:spore germination protein [Alicyclobacillus sendaiensis]|uniref:Spore germination protein n=1 Tax=Alicyclobacillus sendaiensis PA2 TaxID=3029425 RepID=A0ABT6XW01_ALISE|nr:spore germination protein [Alicyclobacillus sendaiensis]MDI9259271.1 spore germination protein [Alicyclobacillus sendaiensis PA2]
MTGRANGLLSKRVEDNWLMLQACLASAPDLKRMPFEWNGSLALVVWIDGLVAAERIQIGLSILRMEEMSKQSISSLKRLGQQALWMSMTATEKRDDVVTAVLEGKAVLFQDGLGTAFIWDVESWPGRQVERAENEPTLQGPQEAFVENRVLNIALVRKRLRSPDLRILDFTIGERTRTTVSLVYVEGITKPRLVQEVSSRLSKVCIDGVVDMNVVREWIADAPRTIFPTIEETERPERVVSGLLQGRVAIIVDGTPMCMVLPATFAQFITSPEDYYMHYTLALPLRLLRHIMFWSSVLLPAVYVSLLTYNQDLVPTPLVQKISSQRAGIPFPTVFEALFMMFAFEALREAGTRLPRAVGQSVSIVGTLVIGEAAVRAGIVSAGMIIIVAATGIASFTAPALGMVQATRLLQFVFVLCAGVFGLYGVAILGIVLIVHLASIRSFGVPYLAPVGPTLLTDWKDALVRAPWWDMGRRPQAYEPMDRKRARGRR